MNKQNRIKKNIDITAIAKKSLVLGIMGAFIFSFTACSGLSKGGYGSTAFFTSDNPDTIKAESGYEISSHILFLQFDSTCSLEEREQIIKDHGMSILLFEKISGVYKVDTGCNLSAEEFLNLCNELKNMKEIVGVTYDYAGKAPGVYW